MSRTGLLDEVRRLGAEFRRRGMEEHLKPLRLYYRSLQLGLTSGKLEVRWTVEHTRMWMEALRLHPFEKALTVLPWRSPCPRCPSPKAGVSEARLAPLRRFEFPGGARSECTTCKATWIEEEPAKR